jgi:nucleoside-diphosphate-sugar epimerase
VRVVITGGAGFLGQLLARRLLATGELTVGTDHSVAIERVILADLRRPSDEDLASDERVEVALGSISSAILRRSIIEAADVTVFHLASMVSAACESDFDRALEVNLDGTRAILEACRARDSRARLVFSSSVVAFGGVSAAETVSDRTKFLPETTYGATKAIGELLVNEYSRKGFIDGRSARLPTVVIRPGRPNAAASAWVSGLFREPLNGDTAVVPVDPDLSLPIAGYTSIVENLVRLCAIDERLFGSDRAVNVPSIDATPRTMMHALEAATDRPLGRVDIRPDPRIQRFFESWAHHAAFETATDLGLVRDNGIESIVHDYIRDFLSPVPHG